MPSASTARKLELAEGFKTITGDEDKIDELLEQSTDFSMSSEEHMNLAQRATGHSRQAKKKQLLLMSKRYQISAIAGKSWSWAGTLSDNKLALPARKARQGKAFNLYLLKAMIRKYLMPA